MFFETIAILCILKKNMTEKEKSIKSLFVTYFDGCYGCDPEPNVANTYKMGVCKLDWDEQSDTLTVHLRHPGLLIGRAGSTINALQKYLDCNIKVIEVNLQK
jgi:hypothetical protein